MEKGVKLEGVDGVRYMYHDPCHTPMKTHEPLKVVNELMGDATCRSERSLLRRIGHARDDAARHLDPGALPQGRGDAQGRRRRCARDGFDGEVKVLTSCPSCLQGLSRFDDDAAPTPTTSSSRSRATGSARTGCGSTSSAPTVAGSSGCWSEGRPSSPAMNEDQGRAELILETALALGERHGWDAVHLHDVAQQLGLVLAEIHRHYRQKDDLAEAWFDRADLALIRAGEYAEWGSLPVRERLSRTILAWFDALAPHRELSVEMLRYKLQPDHLHLQAAG